MRKPTRFLSAALALCLLLSLTPTPWAAEASEHPEADEISTLASGDAAYSGYCGKSGNGTSISWELDLEAETLTFSGTGAMKDYSSVGLTPWFNALEPYNDSGSSIRLTVTVGEGITHISRYFSGAFSDICGEINLPSTLTSIGSHAFEWLSGGLPSHLTIPARITDLGDYAFANCSCLEGVTFEGPEIWTGKYLLSGCKNLKEIHLSDGLTRIPDGFASSCSSLSRLDLPDSVKTVGVGAFRDCTSLSDVKFSAALTTISSNAFSSCSALAGTLNLPDSVTTLDQYAFAYCSSLTGIRWPASLTTVGKEAFRSSGIAGHLDIPEGVSFDLDVFAYCEQITSISLPSSSDYFKYGIFQDCDGLTSAVIPDGWTIVPAYMFRSCRNLTRVTLPESVQTIRSYAFSGCTSLPSIDLPEGLKRIESDAFSMCESLSSIDLPEGLELIWNDAFSSCTSLPSLLVLPESLTELGDRTFKGSSVNTFRFLGNAPSWVCESGMYDSTFNDNCVLYYTPGKSGWDSPTWNGYAAYAILGKDNYEFHDADYYSSLSQRNFDFIADVGPQVEQPVSNVTLTYLGASATTADGQTSISTAFVEEQPNSTVSFTQPEMFDVSLPLEVLSTFNTIEFYPETGAYPTTKPFVQAVYARHSPEDDYADLLHNSLKFYAGSLTEQTDLYVQVYWNGQSGKLYLSQTLDPADGWEIQEGFTEGGNISFRLKADKKPYLLMEYGGQVEAVQLGAALLAEQANLDLVLGDTFDATAPSSGGQFLSEFSFGVDLPKDVSISLKVERDGTVQALLGVKVDEEKEEDIAFDTIKDALEYSHQTKEGLDMEGLRHLLESRGAGVTIQKSAFVVDCSASLLGCAEGKIVKYDNGQYGIVLSKGTVGVSFEGGVTQTFQLYAASVPFYISGSINPKVTFNITLYSNETSDALEVEPIDIKASLEMKVAGGLGWDSIASAGIYGKGTGEVAFKIPMTENDSSCTFQGSIGAEATFFCFSADLVIFEGKKIYLWGEDADTASLSLMALQEADWQPQPRDYLGVEPDLSLDLQAVGEENTVLTAGTIFDWSMYPYATVQTAALSGGRQLAVWTDDQGQRPEANNRTVLYYSYYNGRSWTIPDTVEIGDDETADFNPKLKTINDTVYLVWQDATRSLTAEDTDETIPALLDITCYRFDPASNAFSRMGKFGTEYYDSTMDMTMVDGKFAVVWVSNSANSPFGGSEKTYSIQRLAEGQWYPDTLVDNLYLVDGLAADGEDIWFSADTDGDPNTLADREIFHFDGSTLEQVTHNDAADLKPVITGGQLVWYSNGAIQNGQDTVALAADTDRYQYLRSDAGMEAIVYLEDDEARKTTLYASFNDGTGWGEPIALTGTTGNIGSFSAVFLSDGTLYITACERGLDASQKNRLSGTARLTTYSVTPYCDLAVEDATYLEQSLVKGGTLDIPVRVANHGMANVDIVNIQVKSGSQVLSSSAFEASLASGHSDIFYISVPLGEDPSTRRDLTVTVSASGYTDRTPEDNAASFSLRLSDVSVEGAVASSDGSSTQVKALVVNRGQTDLGDLTVKLYDSADATLLATQTVAAPATGEGTFVTFQLARGMENNRFLTVEATAEGLEPLEENLASNNTSIAVVKGPKAEAFTLAAYAIAGTDGNISAVSTVQNTTQEEVHYSLYFAAYRADGKLLTCQLLADQVTGTGAQSLSQVDFYSPEAAYVRVFVLDDTYTPLAEAAECPV